MKKNLPIISIILTILLIVTLILSNSYVLGSSVDWFKQSAIFYEYFRNLFYETGELFPDLALHIGSGQNIYYFVYYGLFSPYLLLSYLCPFIKSGDFIMISGIICLGISSIMFYHFLVKNNYNKNISLFSSFLFLLSAPIISMSLKHIMFVQYMPFLIMGLFGVKNYLEYRKSFLLIISIILIITTSYYFSISSIICLCLYALYYYIKINNNIKFKIIFKEGIQYFFRVFLGILLSSFLLLPVLYVVLNGRNTTNYVLTLFDFIPQITLKHLLYGSFGVGLTSIVWFSIVYNILYTKNENRILSVLLLIIVSFPIFNVLLNGFIYLNGKIFIPLIPLFIILIANMMQNIKQIKKEQMLYFFFASLFMCLFLFKNDDWKVLLCFLGDFICTFVLLYLCRQNKKMLYILPVLLLSFSISLFNVYRDDLLSIDEYHSFDEIINIPIDEYLYNNVSSIYRYHDNENLQFINYSDASNLYKTSIYSSTINFSYREIFYNFFANNIRHPVTLYIYQDRNIFFNKFMGVRYLLIKKDAPYGYDVLHKYDSSVLYENDNVYSMGFSLSNLLSYADYNKMSFIEKLLSYQNNIIIDGNSNNSDLDFNYEKVDLNYKIIEQKDVMVDNLSDHYIINSKDNGKLVLLLDKPIKNKTLIIRYKVNNDAACDSKASKDGHLSISINSVKNVLTCETNHYYNDNHTFDYVISSNNDINKLNIGFYEGLYDISDIEVYTVDNSLFDKNNTTPLIIDFDKTKGDDIYGSIEVKESGYFIFTIPYDKGYTAYVDNKKVEIEQVNGGFIGFKIDKGSHDIHLTFSAPYAKLGRYLSLVGISILVMLIIFERKKNKI